jgi:hypothetical protein
MHDEVEPLPPEIEAALRQRATWPDAAPSPTMLERAMSQHDAEVQASRQAKRWWRHAGSGGLLAAAVALAAIGLTFGTVTSPRPAGELVFDGAGSISLMTRGRGGMEKLEISSTAVSAAGGEQVATSTTGAAPITAAVPPEAPGAPGLRARGETGGGVGGVGSAFGTSGAQADSSPATPATTTGGATDGSTRAASQAKDSANLIGEAQVDSSQVPGGPISQAAVPPSGEPEGGVVRPMVGSEARRVPPTSGDWALYVTRIVLVGGPWLLMGVALVAIAVIRARNAR